MNGTNIKFDYIICEKDGAFQLGKVFSMENRNRTDSPPNDDDKRRMVEYNDHLPPWRKVMCSISTCDFCNRNVGVDHINQEMTDIDNRMGYFYCEECEPRMIACLKYSGTSSIWYLRERNGGYYNNWVWIPRTRRNENGKRITYGPFIYEKWQIKGWYAHQMSEENGWDLVPHVVCENNELSKSVPVSTILKCNPENDPQYNPNNDPKCSD